MTVPPTPDAGSTSEPLGPPSRGGADPWSAWAADLVEAVRALPDGASLMVEAAPGDARPVLLRPARLGGFFPAKHTTVAPWVRLERAGEHLRGHCVGAESFCGSFPFSPEEDAALVARGWHHPGHGDGPAYVRFWPDDVPQGPFLPRADAERAVAMVAGTFREVLLADPTAGPPTVTPG